jgi:hypothetical protein
MALRFIGILTILIGSMLSLATAKAAEPANYSHILCPDAKAMDRVIEWVKDPDDVTDFSIMETIPQDGFGCSWNRTEIALVAGGQLGWRYSGDYIYSVYSVVTETQTYLMPGRLYRTNQWTLSPACKRLSSLTRLKGGVKLVLIGLMPFTELSKECSTLTSEAVLAEADRKLKEPPKPLAGNSPWASHPEKPNYRNCTSLEQLTDGLDNVVNEQQILNNSKDIFQRKNHCNFRTPHEIIGSRFVGLYRGSSGKFLFAIQQVIYQNPETGNTSGAFMPSFVVRADKSKLERSCTRSVSVPHGGKKGIIFYGSQIGYVAPITIDTEFGPKITKELKGAPIGFAECNISNVRWTN